MQNLNEMLEKLAIGERVEKFRTNDLAAQFPEFEELHFSKDEKYIYDEIEIDVEEAMVIYALNVMSEANEAFKGMEKFVRKGNEREIKRTLLESMIGPDGEPLGVQDKRKGYNDKKFNQLVDRVKHNWERSQADVRYFTTVLADEEAQRIFESIFGTYVISKEAKQEIAANGEERYLAKAEEIIDNNLNALKGNLTLSEQLAERKILCAGALNAVNKYNEWVEFRDLSDDSMYKRMDEATRKYRNAIIIMDRARKIMKKDRSLCSWFFREFRLNMRARRTLEYCIKRLSKQKETRYLARWLNENMPRKERKIKELLELGIEEMHYVIEETERKFRPDLQYERHAEFKELAERSLTNEMLDLIYGKSEDAGLTAEWLLFDSRPNDMKVVKVEYMNNLEQTVENILKETDEQLAIIEPQTELQNQKGFYEKVRDGVNAYIELMKETSDRRLRDIVIGGIGMALAQGLGYASPDRPGAVRMV